MKRDDAEGGDEDDDDAAALRASLELAAQLQAEESRGRRKRARPEAFVAEPSKQMKAEPSPKERNRMLDDNEEVDAEVPQSPEDEEDMIALSSDNEALSDDVKQPKAKKAKKRKKVLTEAEHAAEVGKLHLLGFRFRKPSENHGCVEQVEQAMEAAVEEDEDIDEDEYFMRKFLLEQVSLSMPLTSDPSTEGGTVAKTGTSDTGSTDTAAAPALDRTASNGSTTMGSPLYKSVPAPSKTPPKPRLKTPRKRRAKLNLEAKGPTTTARMVAIESYKEHVKGNVMIRAKAYVSELSFAVAAATLLR